MIDSRIIDIVNVVNAQKDMVCLHCKRPHRFRLTAREIDGKPVVGYSFSGDTCDQFKRERIDAVAKVMGEYCELDFVACHID
jgi:hypothetical protein